MRTPDQTLIASGDPSQDSRAFRSCLSKYATGVTVMTTVQGAHLHGVTANSFTSLSLAPPLILWSIRRNSNNLDAFSTSSHFCVNILHRDQIEASQIFATSESDKFERVAWRRGRYGAPVLEGVSAFMECALHETFDGGDHLIIVGRVLHYEAYPGESLVFANGQYAIAAGHPGNSRAPGTMPAGDAGQQDLPLMSLLFRAYHHSRTRFEAMMREGEMTPQQRWVLSALNDRPRQDADSIARTMFMGMRDAKDALVQLGERGLVSTADGHCYELTAAGCDERQRVRARSVAFEKDEWAGESPAEIAIVRRVLGRLIDKSPSGN